MDVVCFPRLDIPREGGAVVPLADALQQVDLDLAWAMLHAKARPMGFPRQAVATDGNDFGLTAGISRFLHLPLVATGLRPLGSIKAPCFVVGSGYTARRGSPCFGGRAALAEP